jgi:hypothetical protein
MIRVAGKYQLIFWFLSKGGINAGIKAFDGLRQFEHIDFEFGGWCGGRVDP